MVNRHTTGEFIYHDIQAVQGKSLRESTVLDKIGIKDTTSNKGKLGQYFHAHGCRHGYCTDHNFHCIK